MNYSEKLKTILKGSHWTQEQLAAKIGVSFATVNNWIHGRVKPQKLQMAAIDRLYLAQDVTNEPEPIYITLVNADEAKVGDYVKLSKDRENEYDDEAIRAEIMDLLSGEVIRGDSEGVTIEEAEIMDDDDFDVWSARMEEMAWRAMPFKMMHVANSVATVARGTRSAGRIYDNFDTAAKAQVVFKFNNHSAIARVVSWVAQEIIN